MSIESEDLKRAFADALREAGRGGAAGGANVDYAKYVDKLSQSALAAKKNLDSFSTVSKLMPKGQREFNQALGAASSKARELEDVLNDHYNGTKKLSKAQEDAVQKQYKEIKAREEQVETAQDFSSALSRGSNFVKTFGSTLISAAANVAQTIQGGGSGFAIAGAYMEAQADIANQSIQMMTGGASTMGQAMATSGKSITRWTGIVTMGLSSVISTASELGTQAFKAANRIYLAEADKLLKSWQVATGAGAILARGADDMLKSLTDSRYTLEDYAEMVKQNQSVLSDSNIGVAEASKMFGRVGKVLKDTKMDREMLALGFSYQEQGELMAQVAADMRRTDPRAKLEDSRLAQLTRDYAVNLATLSNITGEDAKKKMEESRKLTSQLAFQNFLTQFDPKDAARMREAMGAFSLQQQQNIMDIINFGDIVNQVGAQQAALVPSIKEQAVLAAEALRSGKMTQKGNEELQARYSGAITRQTKAVTEGGIDLAGAANVNQAVTNLAQSLAQEDLQQRKFTDAARIRREAEAAADQGKEAKPGDQSVNSLLVIAQEAGQELRKALQDTIVPILDRYSGIISQMTTDLVNMMKNNAGIAGAPLGWYDTISKYLKEILIAIGVMAAAQGLSALGGKAWDKMTNRGGPKGPTPPSGSTPGGTPGGKPGAPEAKPGTATPTTGGMSPAQKAEYDKLRSQGVGAAEAKNAATRAAPTPGMPGLKEAERRIASEKLLKEGGKRAATEAAEKAVAKEVAEASAKGVTKGILKKIPVLGAILGLGFGAQRAMAGDFAGAGAEVVSGVAGTLPGPGTAASVAIDAGLMAKDIADAKAKAEAAANPNKSVATPTKPMDMTNPTVENTKGMSRDEWMKRWGKTHDPATGKRLPDAEKTSSSNATESGRILGEFAYKGIVRGMAENNVALKNTLIGGLQTYQTRSMPTVGVDINPKTGKPYTAGEVPEDPVVLKLTELLKTNTANTANTAKLEKQTETLIALYRNMNTKLDNTEAVNKSQTLVLEQISRLLA